MPYIGNQPAEQFTSFATQEFSTSATTSYTLDHAVTNENEIALFVNNVRQQPGSGKAYTATGTALTLSAATASTDTMYCVFLGRALQTVNPATNSINNAMVSSSAAIATSKLGAGAIAQVVSATKTDTSSFTSATFADISGLSVAITPSSSSSKILILSYANCGYDYGAAKIGIKLLRGSTVINLGDTAGNRIRMSSSLYINSDNPSTHGVLSNFLDSPSTTSETTYKLQAGNLDASGTVYVNRPGDSWTDATNFASVTSTITAMEVLA